MIAYVDSSVLGRMYLADEQGHDAALALLEDQETALVTGTWTLVEVSGALVRAARSGRGDERRMLTMLDADLSPVGPITMVAAAQDAIEAKALALAREHAIRAMDAWHLATATLVLPALLEPGEDAAFATRDEAQASVAASLGLRVV